MGKKKKRWRPNISMKMFYNFILQERSGELKTIHKGPKQDQYEQKVLRNKKKKKSEREDLPPIESVWNSTLNWKGFEWTIRPHPTSRCLSLERRNEKDKIVRIAFPNELRQPEKKNPILYGGRLKLFYLCDQGVKIENMFVRSVHKNSNGKVI